MTILKNGYYNIKFRMDEVNTNPSCCCFLLIFPEQNSSSAKIQTE